MGTVTSVPKPWSLDFILFVPLFLPFPSGLQPNLLPFPQQQSSLLLPQTGPGLASQVNNHIVPVSPKNGSALDGEAHWFSHPLDGVLMPLGRGTSKGLSLFTQEESKPPPGEMTDPVSPTALGFEPRFQLPG